jgi:hypothetical protein
MPAVSLPVGLSLSEVARYVRLARFSFLILIGRFVMLSRDRFSASHDRLRLHTHPPLTLMVSTLTQELSWRNPATLREIVPRSRLRFHPGTKGCAGNGRISLSNHRQEAEQRVRSPHRNPTSPGRDGVSPQVSHRQNGIPRHTAAHLLRWPCITVAVFLSVTALQLSVAHDSSGAATYRHLRSVGPVQAASAARRVL